MHMGNICEDRTARITFVKFQRNYGNCILVYILVPPSRGMEQPHTQIRNLDLSGNARADEGVSQGLHVCDYSCTLKT